MQLLYANDGINYRTISKSPSLTFNAEKNLLESYMKYDFVNNSDCYSSVLNEPEAICYAVSNLNNALSTNHLIVTKTGHMSIYSTPSYYFHALIEKVDDHFFKEDFFEIFNYRFINDNEMNSIDNIDNYQFKHVQQNNISLTDAQLITILATFMNNEKSNRKTKIIVDASGDQYNKRSREILASIYHYLPYELRKRYGFLTYSKEDDSGIGRVSFVLYNKDELKNINNSYIKLDEIDLNNLNQRIDKKYINYVTYLVKELDEEGRKEHFEKLTTIAQNGRLKIDDCITYYSNLKKWMNGTQENLLKDWIDYVDQNSFRKGPLYELMIEIIQSKVDNEYYNKYLFEKILELYNVKIESLTPNATKTIRFSDCIPGLKIDEERMMDWYKNQLMNKVKGLHLNNINETIQYKKIIEKEISIISEIDIGSLQFKEILNHIIDGLNETINSINEKLDDNIDKEIENIGEQFNALKNVSINEFKKQVDHIRNSIVFDESKEIFCSNLEEWLQENINNLYSEIELNKYAEFINDYKDDMSDNAYDKFMKAIQLKINQIKEEKKAKQIKLTNKISVLNSYKIIQEDLNRGILNKEDEIEVCFNINTKIMKVEEVEKVLSFILAPMPNVEINDYLDELFELKLLSVEHFKYLIETQNGYGMKKVLDYYFKGMNTIEISGVYAAYIINNYATSFSKKTLDYYKDDESTEVQLFVSQFKKKSKKVNKIDIDDDFNDFNETESNKNKKKSFGFFRK
jgi:hypothetical protein